VSITLERVNAVHGSSVQAQIRHGDHVFGALVSGDIETLQPLLGRESLVEMSFEQIASWRKIPAFEDEDSCIRASATIPGAVMLQGRVHNVLPIDSESSVVDLYLRTGPEFVAINSKQLGGFVPKVGSALEIHVHGLCFYPTDT
jgi:hypothetical protein